MPALVSFALSPITTLAKSTRVRIVVLAAAAAPRPAALNVTFSIASIWLNACMLKTLLLVGRPTTVISASTPTVTSVIRLRLVSLKEPATPTSAFADPKRLVSLILFSFGTAGLSIIFLELTSIVRALSSTLSPNAAVTFDVMI